MKVLNAGYVHLINWMGGDRAAIDAARRCYDSEGDHEANARLIKHLLKKGHESPFEFMVFTFDVKAPTFVARQWMRHRIGSFAERSLRYCEAEAEFFVPDNIAAYLGKEAWHFENSYEIAMETYYMLIEKGVPREQARALLPLGLYTTFLWSVNGRSLLNFLRLREDKSAQAEIREYAQAIRQLAAEVAPLTFGEEG